MTAKAVNDSRGARDARKNAPAVSVRSADTQRRVGVNGVASARSLRVSAADWRSENIGRLLLYAYHAFELRMIEGYRAAGFDDVRQVHLNALRYVDVKRGTRIVELAARVGVTKGAMGQMLEDCVRHDLVQIEADPSDNRAKLVKLSKRGTKFMLATERSVAAIERDFQKRLGAKEYEALVALLRRLGDGAAAPQR